MNQHARTPFLAVKSLAQKLEGDSQDYDALLTMAEDKQFVLLGKPVTARASSTICGLRSPAA
jgi:hypothetical protein